MSGGMGIGGMGMGMSMPTMTMPSIMPTMPFSTPGPSFMAAQTPPAPLAMSGPMPSTPVQTPTPYVSVAPQFTGAQVPNVPEAAIAPTELGGSPIYNEGDVIPGANSYKSQDTPYMRPDSKYPEYNPYDVMEDVTGGTWGDAVEPGDGMGAYKPGTMRTPTYDPENLRNFPPTEFSAQSRPDALKGVKADALRTAFDAAGGAGPSAPALQAEGGKGFAAPKEGTMSPGIRNGLVSAEQANNVRMMDSALDKAGFSANQRDAILEQIYRENNFRSELLFGRHAEPIQNHPASGRENIGALSWGDPGRNAAFKAYMREAGVMDANGNMKPGQATADAQAAFIKQEMSTYKTTAEKFLNNPNVDKQTARIVLGDDYVKWARTNPKYSSHTGKMERFSQNLNQIRAGAKTFPTPEGSSLANVPLQSYGKVNVADMKVTPTPLQQAALQTAPVAPITAAQGIQRAFSAAPISVTTPQAPVAAAIDAAPTTTASMAIEQAFTTPMPNGAPPVDTSLAQRAQANLSRLQNDPNALLFDPTTMMNRTDLPMAGGGYNQTLATDPTNYAAQFTAPKTVPMETPAGVVDVPINVEAPAAVAETNPALQTAVDTIQRGPQSASQRPLEARTGVSRSAPLPTPQTKSSGEEYSSTDYLDNKSLLNIGPIAAKYTDGSPAMMKSFIDEVAKALGIIQQSRKKKK
jgi:hypothetical protein